ncbi:MAG: HlyD family efflux transporter periplasmic adaptor subunit [Bacteroidota bacterium]
MDKQIKKKKFTAPKILLLAALLGTVGYLGINAYNASGTTRMNVYQDRLMIDTIHTDVFQESIPVTGVVMPLKTVYIDAIEGGKVEERFVEDGAMVKKGQPILKLSNPDLLLSSLNQEANIIAQINQIRNTSLLMEQQSLNLKEQALNVDYQIDLTDSRLERNRLLLEDNIVSRVEVEEMEDEYENLLRRRDLLRATIKKDSTYQELQLAQMQSSIDLMERNLEISRKSLANLTIQSPIDGQLSGVTLEIGELVTTGENIAQVDNLENFKIQVRIDEYYIDRVFLNQIGTFEFANATYSLRISKIYPQVSDGRFNVDMVFVGEWPQGIRRGQSVSVRLELSAEKESRLLAKGGFYQSTGGRWIYVIDPNTGNARRRDIRVGSQNPEFFEVITGLEDGEVVITSSYDNFGDKDELILQ